jgi:hypothetical protein
MLKPDFEFTNSTLCLCLVGHSIACSEYLIDRSYATHAFITKYYTYAFLGADTFKSCAARILAFVDGSRLLGERVRKRLEFAGKGYE